MTAYFLDVMIAGAQNSVDCAGQPRPEINEPEAAWACANQLGDLTIRRSERSLEVIEYEGGDDVAVGIAIASCPPGDDDIPPRWHAFMGPHNLYCGTFNDPDIAAGAIAVAYYG